jgi:hypothetical protein
MLILGYSTMMCFSNIQEMAPIQVTSPGLFISMPVLGTEELRYATPAVGKITGIIDVVLFSWTSLY